MIELLIALALGALVLAGVSTVFVNTSKTYRVQEGLAQLQENGRFALYKISEDLRQGGSVGCTNHVNAPAQGGLLRGEPIKSYVSDPGFGWPTRIQVNQELTSKGLPGVQAGQPYDIDPRHLFRGHECDGGGCVPAQNSIAADPSVSAVMSVGAGDRVPSTDVLTIRRVVAAGARIANRIPAGALPDARPGLVGGDSPIPLEQAGSLPPLEFVANDLAMLSNCDKKALFSPGSIGSTDITHTTADGNVSDNFQGFYTRKGESKLLNVTKDFPTVSYYLQVVDNTAQPGRVTSALMRQRNGVVQELVRGVERLDFRYAVVAGDNTIQYLTAAEIDSRNGGALACPPSAIVEADKANAILDGCLWAGVTAVEVSMLINTVSDVDVAAATPYFYHIDGATAVTPGGTMPESGLPSGRMVRRQFTAVIGLRNLHL